MNILRSLILAAATMSTCRPANLAISTYLKDGFTPTAIASDPQGNIYLAGIAVIDPASQTTGAVVVKLNPKVTQYLYLAYLDSAASDQVSAIAIDGAGNAYIAGSTTNPNFPAVAGAALGTAPTGATDTRSFVTKLNPEGAVVFSVLIGGSAMSTAQGIAVAPQGQILVSGIAGSTGFPFTSGAYNVANSTNQWFLLELDAAADKTIFSATGIGGSSIAMDAAGDIYMAGSSPGADYPTTPGAYQTTFVQGYYCYGLCQIDYTGNLQHVTKVDPAASKLIYSTGLNDITGPAGSTTNTGLAVDAGGNAYVTGTLFEAEYPFTVTAPANSLGYLTKLDPAGANVVFSVPVGGAGVQLDSSGAVYVGGMVSSYNPYVPIPPIPPTEIPAVFSWVPQGCLPNNAVTNSSAYAMKIDPATGAVQDAQWIDGSAPGATGIAFADGKVWITGATPGPDVPFSPGVLAPRNLGPGYLAGAYLAAVDFSGGANTGPAIACVVDGANFTHVGAVAAFQLITIVGAYLGPAAGVPAPDGTDTSIAGVSITFNGMPAQLLYVSASQINVAVPFLPPPDNGANLPPAAVMQMTVNGAVIQRQFPFAASNLNLFANLTSPETSCASATFNGNGAQPLALNADGSVNSCSNPAKYGSTVSLFVEGAGGYSSPPPQSLFPQALVGVCAAAVPNASLIDGFVYKVDVTMPGAQFPCAEDYSATPQTETGFPVTLSYNGLPVGPLYVPGAAFPVTNNPIPVIVWVSE